MSYAVVLFDTNAISRAPMQWLLEVKDNEAKCLWPVRRAEWYIATLASPEPEWPEYPVQILAKDRK